MFNRNKCMLCNSKQRPLFTFPKDNNRFLLWLKNIEKEDLLKIRSQKYIYNNGKLCFIHFRDEHFTSTLKTKLIRDAVPFLSGDRNKISKIESLDCISKQSSFVSKSNCTTVEKILSYPKMMKEVVSFSKSVDTNAESLIKVKTKKTMSSLTGSNIEMNSSVPIETTSLNKFSEKVPKSSKISQNFTAPDVAENLSVTGDTAFSSKVSEKTQKSCKTMPNLASELAENPDVTIITLCCTDTKEAIAFHRFLQDPEQRTYWISKMKCQNLKPSHISVLCPKHFSQEPTNYQSEFKENGVQNIFALDSSQNKIFIKGRECVNGSRKVSFENISSLLQEIDSYEICAGIDDKSMTYCIGHLENGSEKPFSIWCKGCQRKGKELMDSYKLR